MFTAILWTILIICVILVLIGLVLPIVFAYRCEHDWQPTNREGGYSFKECAVCHKTKKEKLS